MTGITQSEWLAALETAMASRRPDDPGATAEEIAATWGVSVAVTRARLGAIRDRLLVGKRTGTTIDGRTCRVPCYRLKVE